MLAETTARNYRVFVWLAVLVVIAGAGLTLASPTYSAQSPQRTLVWYAQDADHHDARWVTQTDSHRVPIELAITRLFNRSGQSIPAPLLNLQAPQLEILKAEARGDERVYRLKIRSLRAAPEIELALPAALEVRTVSVLSSGQTHTVLPWRDPSQTGWLKLIGVPPEGLELEVTTGATRDGAFRIIDRSYGLPEAAAAPHARRPDETSSQDGDLTIVYRSVRLPPIARAPSS